MNRLFNFVHVNRLYTLGQCLGQLLSWAWLEQGLTRMLPIL
jgi:hypothetical protein